MGRSISLFPLLYTSIILRETLHAGFFEFLYSHPYYSYPTNLNMIEKMGAITAPIFLCFYSVFV